MKACQHSHLHIGTAGQASRSVSCHHIWLACIGPSPVVQAKRNGHCTFSCLGKDHETEWRNPASGNNSKVLQHRTQYFEIVSATLCYRNVAGLGLHDYISPNVHILRNSKHVFKNLRLILKHPSRLLPSCICIGVLAFRWSSRRCTVPACRFPLEWSHSRRSCPESHRCICISVLLLWIF